MLAAEKREEKKNEWALLLVRLLVLNGWLESDTAAVEYAVIEGARSEQEQRQRRLVCSAFAYWDRDRRTDRRAVCDTVVACVFDIRYVNWA